MDSESIYKDSIPANLNVLYKEYPELITGLFSRLNLNRTGLEKVKDDVLHHQWITACYDLVDYYKRKSKAHGEWFPAKTAKQDTASRNLANDVLKNVFTFQHVTGRQDTLKDGQLNWNYLGPRNDKEWGYFLNRQGYFSDILAAYKTTGRVAYAKKFSDLVSDWVLTNPAPDKKVGSETWRELEVGLRLTESHWPKAFYGFQSAPAFTDVSRILMLSSIPEQADYIMKYHRMHSNWTAMELNGLASAAFYWPEFKNASGWFQHAIKKMQEEMAFEVYPDGVQNELTSHYHEVAMDNFEEFAELSKKAGHKLPIVFQNTIEKMYNYLAYTMRPNGYGLLNNDSNLDYTRDKILHAAEKRHRADWKFIATNGEAGEEPKKGPSVFFPWAGQMIMRSGWGGYAEWAFFDDGPWGNAHQHNDKLHLSVSAYGHDWLVDAGRYYYKWDKWRLYFVSSTSHNVILIDGRGERPYNKLASKPIKKGYSIQNGLDFCIGRYNNGFSSDWWKSNKSNHDSITANWTRAVLFLHNRYWVVVDHVRTQKPEAIEPLWHFAPSLTLKRKRNTIIAIDSSNNHFQLIPSDPSRWEVTIIKGQKKPEIQGWYSKAYNEKIPNYCVKYHTMETDTSATFAWVLYPSKKGTKKMINIKVLKAPRGVYRLQLKTPDDLETKITIRFYGKKEIPVSPELFLDGRCAVIQKGIKPVVACGVIKNKKGKIIMRDLTRSLNVQGNKKLDY